MKDLNSIIEERIMKFKEKFCKKRVCQCCRKEICDYSTTGCPWYTDTLFIDISGKPYQDTALEIELFLRQSLTEIVKEALEAVELEEKKSFGGIETDEDAGEFDGFNQAVSEQKSKANKFLNK